MRQIDYLLRFTRLYHTSADSMVVWFSRLKFGSPPHLPVFTDIDHTAVSTPSLESRLRGTKQRAGSGRAYWGPLGQANSYRVHTPHRIYSLCCTLYVHEVSPRGAAWVILVGLAWPRFPRAAVAPPLVHHPCGTHPQHSACSQLNGGGTRPSCAPCLLHCACNQPVVSSLSSGK